MKKQKKCPNAPKFAKLLMCGTVLLLATAAAGCGGEQPAEEPTETGYETEAAVQKDESRYRVGGAVSDAYVNPDQYKVDEKDLKATGYEYDYESLTYELVWSDEFDYEGEPDPALWDYDTGGHGWGNNELQYYTKGDNVTVGDDLLTIELRKEELGGREYTSTRLVSRHKGDWLYGKVEVSAKLPSGKGTWPAIWMLPTDWAYGDWPASGEIDIMEHVGYDQDVIVQSAHNNRFNASNAYNHSTRVEGVSEEFHVYGLEWLPDKLIFTIDGEVQNIYDPHTVTSQVTKDHWPYDKRMHLLINLAFGGDWGGAMGVDDSYLPVEYYIDYVRVYQSPEIMELTGQK